MESNFMRKETRAMDKKDMTLLIEAEDAINDMDRLLVQLICNDLLSSTN